MKWLKDFILFKEAKDYSNKDLVYEICVSMVLLNNNFLDNILDKGLKNRYEDKNTEIFITEIKNLLLSRNRLNLGKFIDEKCVIDDETSKINLSFEDIKFDINKDWNTLVNARITARSIIDKLLPDDKLDSNFIKNIFWLGPNKDADYKEDIVIELNNSKQYSFLLDQNLSNTKTASFNKFADELIGEDTDNLFKGEYLDKWNQLTQKWIKVIYENVNKDMQSHIEKFIETNNIQEIGYFDYFNIKHKNEKYKHLGEFIKEFNRNILKLSDLLGEIWKKRDTLFLDLERVENEWYQNKVVLLNSKILEKILTTSLKDNYSDDIETTDTNFKKANGNIKMKLFKILVEKLGCLERNLYYISKKGENFNMIPSKDFFRKFYNDLDIFFDYHVSFVVDDDENDFDIKLNLSIDDTELIGMLITVKFSGAEMSGKLSAKYNFELSNRFNYIISKKIHPELS